MLFEQSIPSARRQAGFAKNLSQGESCTGGRRPGGRSSWLRGRLPLLLATGLSGLFLLIDGAYASHKAGAVPGPVNTTGSNLVLGSSPSPGPVSRADSGSVLTTFRVTPSAPVGGSLWTVSGNNLHVTVGAPIVGPEGTTIGYHVVGGGGGTTISSHTWSQTQTGMVPINYWPPLYVSALYASDSNAHAGAGAPIGSAPGYIDNLGKFGLGQGPGWVAVDPTTGNYLLLSVTSSESGSYQCGSRGQYCSGRVESSSLGELDVNWFGNRLNANISAGNVLTASIPDGHPFTGTGCFGSTNYMALPAGTCTGASLKVTISPVGVLRGDDGGVQSLSKSGGRTPGGGWSAGGEYVLYLTGVSVSP